MSESTLKDPLPWDVVPPESYEELGRVQPYVASLRQGSRQRVSTEEAFRYLQADIARLRQAEVAKSVSLNEAERRQELAQDKTRRDQEARTLHAAAPPTYEITLENLSSPGLPPPMTSPGPAPNRPSAEPDDASAKSTPAEDIVLNEGVRILGDYVGLLGHRAASASR